MSRPVLLLVAALAEDKRLAVVVEPAKVVEHERQITSAAALAASTYLADPYGPHLLQLVATEDTSGVAVLFTPGPRLRRVLETTATASDRARAVRLDADGAGADHARARPPLVSGCRS